MGRLSWHAVEDRATWDDMVRSMPHHHILQSWEWGEFKGQYGWTAERLAFRGEDGRVVAAAQLLTRQARPLPVSIMYVPKGPLLDCGDENLCSAVFNLLAERGQHQGAIFLKIDPDVVIGTGQPGAPDDRPDPIGQAVAAQLAARGWRFSTDQIQFRNTVQLDLRQTEGQLLAAMKQKTRYNIRLSGRRGVQVRAGDPGDLELLFKMYAETAERDAFLIRPLAYYRDAWGTFMEAGLACPLIAEIDGEPVASLILFYFGHRVWYMYGASRNVHREKMPNHLLQWEAIIWAKRQGYQVYDMWGAPNVFNRDDPMWGVWRFKAGFGGTVVRHIGAWDLVLAPRWHWIYTQLVPRYLTFRRQLGV